MKFYLSALFLFSVLFISCNKDDGTPKEEQELSEPNFYALKVGNSWKYQYFKRIGQTDQFESLDAFDDVRITGTSEINGNTYFNFETITTGNDTYPAVPDNGTVITKFRDSAGYLINEYGWKYFSFSNPNQEYLIRDEHNETKLYGTQIGNGQNVEVISGNFFCTVNELYLRYSDGTKLPSTDYYFYSEGIGLVKSTCSFVSNPLYIVDKRLISYNIGE